MSEKLQFKIVGNMYRSNLVVQGGLGVVVDGIYLGIFVKWFYIAYIRLENRLR